MCDLSKNFFSQEGGVMKNLLLLGLLFSVLFQTAPAISQDQKLIVRSELTEAQANQIRDDFLASSGLKGYKVEMDTLDGRIHTIEFDTAPAFNNLQTMAEFFRELVYNNMDSFGFPQHDRPYSLQHLEIETQGDITSGSFRIKHRGDELRGYDADLTGFSGVATDEPERAWGIFSAPYVRNGKFTYFINYSQFFKGVDDLERSPSFSALDQAVIDKIFSADLGSAFSNCWGGFSGSEKLAFSKSDLRKVQLGLREFTEEKPGSNLEETQLRLVWRYDLQNDYFDGWVVYVDAHTGELLEGTGTSSHSMSCSNFNS